MSWLNTGELGLKRCKSGSMDEKETLKMSEFVQRERLHHFLIVPEPVPEPMSDSLDLWDSFISMATIRKSSSRPARKEGSSMKESRSEKANLHAAKSEK